MNSVDVYSYKAKKIFTTKLGYKLSVKRLSETWINFECKQ